MTMEMQNFIQDRFAAAKDPVNGTPIEFDRIERDSAGNPTGIVSLKLPADEVALLQADFQGLRFTVWEVRYDTARVDVHVDEAAITREYRAGRISYRKPFGLSALQIDSEVWFVSQEPGATYGNGRLIGGVRKVFYRDDHGFEKFFWEGLIRDKDGMWRRVVDGITANRESAAHQIFRATKRIDPFEAEPKGNYYRKVAV